MLFWERPSRDKEAMRVRFLPQFLGALPRALSPLGALPYSVVSEMFVSHSSTKTSLFGSSSLTLLCQALLAASSRSEAATLFFYKSNRACGSPGSSWRWRLSPHGLAPTARSGALRSAKRPQRSLRVLSSGCPALRHRRPSFSSPSNMRSYGQHLVPSFIVQIGLDECCVIWE